MEQGAFCLRPGYIHPMHGLKSKVGWYNAVYTAMGWQYPFWRWLMPVLVTSTEEVARRCWALARRGYTKRVLETADIHKVADGAASE